MSIYIHIYSNKALGEPRTDLEDELEDLLGDAGECTGGGQGNSGWNIDLEIFEKDHIEKWTICIKDFLKERSVPNDTYFDVLPVDWQEGMERRVVNVFPEDENLR